MASSPVYGAAGGLRDEPAGPSTWGKPGAWPVRKRGVVSANTRAAEAWIRARWPITDIGDLGTRAYFSDHPLGKALDAMLGTDDVNRDPPKLALGNAVAAWFVAHPNVFGTKYVIFNRRENDLDGRGWHAYTGPGGPHIDHVHVSLLSGSERVKGGGDPNAGPPTVPDVPAGAGGVATRPVGWLPSVADARTLVLTGLFTAAGVGLIAIGAWRATSSST
jgi:hypothetical protein